MVLEDCSLSRLSDTPRPIGRGFLDRSKSFLFHSSMLREQLGYRIKVPMVRTFTATNQPKFSKTHSNSAGLTYRMPYGRSARDNTEDSRARTNTQPERSARSRLISPPDWAMLYGKFGNPQSLDSDLFCSSSR